MDTKIISSVHDFSQITPSGPAGDPLELSATKGQAIRRANLATTDGKVAVFSANEVPWHGLGTVTEGAQTSLVALQLSGCDFKVEKTPVRYDFNGTPQVVENDHLILRTDTGVVLGRGTDRYTILQNSEAFSIMDSFLGKYDAHYETAGAIDGGRRVWMLARFGKSFTVGGTDEVVPYLILTNSHDGTEPVRIYPTTMRVVCQNTYNAASRLRTMGYSFRHTANMANRINEAARLFANAHDDHAKFAEAAQYLATQFIDPMLFFNRSLDKVAGITEAEMNKGVEVLLGNLQGEDRDRKEKSLNRAIRDRKEMLDAIQNRFESETCNGIETIRGTAWSAWNAVTEYADHALTAYRGTTQTKRERRFVDTQVGAVAEWKHNAFELALELTA